MFNQIENLVTTAPCLAVVDLDKETVELVANSDALLVAAGGVVLVNISGKSKPIVYYGQKFNDIEQHYITIDR